MDLWERLELIEQITNNYRHGSFKEDFTNSFWAWFYLAKVSVCLFFGWQSNEEPDSDWIWGLAYFDEDERIDWDAPMGSKDWKEICIPCGLKHWYFAIANNSNY